jgi:hypothetical protein
VRREQRDHHRRELGPLGLKASSNGMKNLKGRRTTIKVGLGAKGF